MVFDELLEELEVVHEVSSSLTAASSEVQLFVDFDELLDELEVVQVVWSSSLLDTGASWPWQLSFPPSFDVTAASLTWPAASGLLIVPTPSSASPAVATMTPTIRTATFRPSFVVSRLLSPLPLMLLDLLHVPSWDKRPSTTGYVSEVQTLRL